MLLTKLHTYWKLGPVNLLRVVFYRLALKSGYLRYLMPVENVLEGNLFEEVIPPEASKWAQEFSGLLKERQGLTIFGWKEYDGDLPPNWYLSLLSGKEHSSPRKHWTEISDFSPENGDIKEIWEVSRFDWSVFFATQAILENDTKWLSKLNLWVLDWNEKNPANQGPNWKCGQEASLRVIHLALSALLLGQQKRPSNLMVKMLEQHLRRIEPTLSYAMAQDNNHGTSEAAALFVGGTWLSALGNSGRYEKWRNKGRKWLENRMQRLIETDGSFSQHSVNYHRLMLDTIIFAEVWRRSFDEKLFSGHFYEKARAATDWLRDMTDPETGDVPTLGANDGAQILSLSRSGYRDYRSTVQTAAGLFRDARAYKASGAYDMSLGCFGISPAGELPAPKSRIYTDGGYAVLRNETSVCYMRLPRFRFRPSHCDVMHVDLFVNHANILRDGGSYSYNTEKKWQNYFPGTGSHNTVQFDDREQMPKISRFLFGRWLEGEFASEINIDEEGGQVFSAFYQDFKGASHRRSIQLNKDRLIVKDDVSGFQDKAVVRWRLAPGDWQKNGCSVEGAGMAVRVGVEGDNCTLELTEGWESRYYGQKTPLPVLEVTVHSGTTITTEINWA